MYKTREEALRIQKLKTAARVRKYNKTHPEERKAQKKIDAERAKARYYLRRIKFLELKGGKCVYCGYSRNQRALSFHHLHSKDYDVSAMMSLREDAILKELEKCVILCLNCHKEVHFPHGLK